MSPRVVCVGDLMVDVLARLPGPLAPGSDTPAPTTVHGGGAAANVASWLAYAAADVTFLGRVGDDALGRFAVAELECAGVTVAVTLDPDRPTGTVIVLVDPDGERTMIPDAGANAGLGTVPVELPDDVALLYVSGYALLGAGSRPFALAALEQARRRGCPVAADAASAAPLTPVAGEFGTWLGPDVLVFANADEARVLTGATDPRQAARELGRRHGAAVVKRGAAGALWSDGEQLIAVRARPVRVVDSTGAGDAFAAGFLAAQLQGADVAGCLDAAVGLAARAVGQVGARPRPQGRV